MRSQRKDQPVATPNRRNGVAVSIWVQPQPKSLLLNDGLSQRSMLWTVVARCQAMGADNFNLVVRPKVFQTLSVLAHRDLGFDTCSESGQALPQAVLLWSILILPNPVSPPGRRIFRQI